MSFWKDVQFSLRSMRKSPRIALTVLATLTLGIGANTAIFSVVNATLLKPLPFHNPGELVELNADLRGLGAHNVGFSVPEFEDLRDRGNCGGEIAPEIGAAGNTLLGLEIDQQERSVEHVT